MNQISFSDFKKSSYLKILLFVQNQSAKAAQWSPQVPPSLGIKVFGIRTQLLHKNINASPCRQRSVSEPPPLLSTCLAADEPVRPARTRAAAAAAAHRTGPPKTAKCGPNSNPKCFCLSILDPLGWSTERNQASLGLFWPI